MFDFNLVDLSGYNNGLTESLVYLECADVGIIYGLHIRERLASPDRVTATVVQDGEAVRADDSL